MGWEGWAGVGAAEKHRSVRTASRAPDPLPLRQDGSHHQESRQQPREASSVSPTQRPLCGLLALEGPGPLGQAAAPPFQVASVGRPHPHRGPTALTGGRAGLTGSELQPSQPLASTQPDDPHSRHR